MVNLRSSLFWIRAWSAVALLSSVALLRIRLANMGVKNLGAFLLVGEDVLLLVLVVVAEERRNPGVLGNVQACVVRGVRASNSPIVPCRSIRRRRRCCADDAVMIVVTTGILRAVWCSSYLLFPSCRLLVIQ